jgi:hypothetical protein
MVTAAKSGTGRRVIDGRAGLAESDVRAFTIPKGKREGSRAGDRPGVEEGHRKRRLKRFGVGVLGPSPAYRKRSAW